MRKEVSAMEARHKLGELLDQAYHRDDHFIVTRANKPMAALISIHAYHQFLKQREKDFEVLDRIWAKVPTLPEDEVEADIEAAIAEVRQEKAKARKTTVSGGAVCAWFPTPTHSSAR